MAANLAWNSSFMSTTLHCSFSMKACGLAIFFKVVLASSKVAFTAASLEISTYSWISNWLIKISWPCTCPWILPSFVASQVHKKSHNKSSRGVVHYNLKRPSKLVRLTHLSSLESIFIHCNIVWLSFTLDVVFFLISFSTCSFASTLFFHFIMALVLDLGRQGITLQTSSSPKSSSRNSSPLSLLIGCYNSFSSIGFGARACSNYSLAIGWNKISTSSFESKITITCGVGVVVEEVTNSPKKIMSCF